MKQATEKQLKYIADLSDSLGIEPPKVKTATASQTL